MSTQLQTINELKAYPIRKLFVHDGTLEVLKWIALFSMFIDHLNRFIFKYEHFWMQSAGRLALPLFLFVLAYNLARDEKFNHSRANRMMKRMFLFGLLAVPAILALNKLTFNTNGILPLNIMFSLIAVTAVIKSIEAKEYGWKFDVAMLLAASMLVDYEVFGVLFGIAAYRFIKEPSKINKIILIAALMLLIIPGGSIFVMAALPLILYAESFVFTLEKHKNMFYWVYPMHFYILLLGISFSRHML